MNQKKNFFSLKNKRIFPLLLFLIGTVFILVGSFYGNHTGLFWTKWFPLLIPEYQVDDSVLTNLEDVTEHQVLSRGSVRYFYNGFSGMESLNSDQLEGGERLVSHDPRLDPFLRGAKGYFKQDAYEIFYLPADRSPVQYRQALKQAWDPAWVLPDADRDVPLLLFAGLIAFLIIIQSGRGLVPCLLAVFHIGLTLLLRGQSIVLPGLIYLFLLSQYRKNGKFHHFLSVLIPATGYFAFHFGMFTGMDFAILSFLFLSGLAIDPRSSSEKKRRRPRPVPGKDHDLFVPVPLSPRKEELSEEKAAGKLSIPVSVAVLAVLLGMLFAMSAAENRLLPVRIPMARSEAGGEWSWENIARLSRSESVPGVREMLMHRVYQEALPYGGTWSFPNEGESVSLPVYRMENGEVRSSLKIIQLYDQEWLDCFLRGMPEEGPGALLRSEPALPVVSAEAEVPKDFSDGALKALGFLGIMGIILSLLNAATLHHRGLEDHRKRNNLLVFRRKQQAA